jgi:hypothetical protein
LLNRFLLTRLLTLFPKEHFPQNAYEFYGLLEIICGVREYGWIWIVSNLFNSGLGLGT